MKLNDKQRAALVAVVNADQWALIQTDKRTLAALYMRGLIVSVDPSENAARWLPTAQAAAALNPDTTTRRRYQTNADRQKAYRQRAKSVSHETAAA